MSTFPVTIAGREYASPSELASDLRERAVGDHRSSPGHAYPSEHFMGHGDAVERAVHAALSELVDDGHPEVLRAITHLAGGHPDPEFWRALVARVGGRGPALPAEVADEVARMLVDPVAEGSFVDEGLAAFAAAGMPGHRLRVRLQTGTTSERVSALALAASGDALDVGLAKRAGRVLARKDGDEGVIAGAAAIWATDPEVREAFRAGAIRGDAAWAHRDDLTQALRLS